MTGFGAKTEGAEAVEVSAVRRIPKESEEALLAAGEFPYKNLLAEGSTIEGDAEVVVVVVVVETPPMGEEE